MRDNGPQGGPEGGAVFAADRSHGRETVSRPARRLRIACLAFVELDVANACSIHTREIGEGLAALGHDVTVILPRPLRAQAWSGVRHVWVRWWGFDRLRALAFHLQCAVHLLRLHLAEGFDLLYLREAVPQPLLPGLARRLGLPLFVEVNGWALDDLRLVGASEQELDRARDSQRELLRSARGLVVSTAGNARRIAQEYGVPADRILVQELGTNTDLFSPGDREAARAALGLPERAPIILFAGSFHPHHDLATVVEAFAKTAAVEPSARLLLVGEGALRRPIEARVKALGLTESVRMEGARPYEAMPAYFRAADLAVLPLTAPKIRQQQGAFAAKLWDYMAAGLPLVVTDLPDSLSYPLLADKAVLVPPGEASAMAEAFRSLLADRARREALGRAGRDYVLAHRSWRRAALETASFIEARLASGGEG